MTSQAAGDHPKCHSSTKFREHVWDVDLSVIYTQSSVCLYVHVGGRVMRVLQDTIHCSHFSPWQEEEGAWQMAVLLLDTAEGHWDEAVVNGAQKSMEKL